MRNSNKLLALALAAVLALGSTATAFAADEDKAGEGTAAPISDTVQTPAGSTGDADKKDESKPADGEDKKDESKPADGEDKKDESKPADGEDKKDESKPADGEDKKDESKPTDGEDKKDESKPADGEDKKDESKPADGEDKKDESKPADGEDKKDESKPAAMPYTDFTEQNWYYGAVAFVTENKLMDGLTETTFGPTEHMTRQMLAVALYRLAGSPKVTAENPFTDVADDAAYKDAVVWAYSVGVVNGVTETTFSPDSSIQRQAIAAMLARYLKVDTSAGTDVSAFADADQIQSYAIGSMAWASANKLLQGDTNSNVDPRGNATRAQVATILQRFAEMAEGKAPTADAEVQYDYQLKAGETTKVDGAVFEKMVTVTVDPASTRDAANELRSHIVFDNCVFNGGLTVVGDFHAMVSLDSGCSFGEGSVVTCKEATSGVAKKTTMDDNFVKIFVGCEGVTVETESAVGVVIENADVVFNGTTYSKSKLAPDADYLGVYSLYEKDSMTYTKLALGEDDSVEVLD